MNELFVHADEVLLSALAHRGQQADVVRQHLFFQRQRLLTGHRSFGEWRKFCGYFVHSREQQAAAADRILGEVDRHACPEIKSRLMWCQRLVRSVDHGLALAATTWLLQDAALDSVGFVLRDAIWEFKGGSQ